MNTLFVPMLNLRQEMMDFGLFCRKSLMKKKIKWSLFLCFKVTELHTGGSVCFDTAGIKEPPEMYCSSSLKRQILHGSMKRFELFQLTGRLFEENAGFCLTYDEPGLMYALC